MEEQIPFATVTLVDARGSVPQEPGAKMLVSPREKTNPVEGTIGGGKVEVRAIQHALSLLEPETPGKTAGKLWFLERDMFHRPDSSFAYVGLPYHLHRSALGVAGKISSVPEINSFAKGRYDGICPAAFWQGLRALSH